MYQSVQTRIDEVLGVIVVKNVSCDFQMMTVRVLDDCLGKVQRNLLFLLCSILKPS